MWATCMAQRPPTQISHLVPYCQYCVNSWRGTTPQSFYLAPLVGFKLQQVNLRTSSKEKVLLA